jgi:hypothetical protein
MIHKYLFKINKFLKQLENNSKTTQKQFKKIELFLITKRFFMLIKLLNLMNI